MNNPERENCRSLTTLWSSRYGLGEFGLKNNSDFLFHDGKGMEKILKEMSKKFSCSGDQRFEGMCLTIYTFALFC